MRSSLMGLSTPLETSAMNQSAFLAPDELLSHKTFIQNVVRGVLRDHSDVQDAVQETWMAALKRSDQIQSNPRGWLRTTALRKALELKRNRQRQALREAAHARPEADVSVESSMERLEIHSDVVRAVLGLDDPYRSVVLMRYFQGLEPSAIAERLGAKASTVRSQLTRAHEQLRDRLDREHDRSLWAALALPAAGMNSAAAGKAAGISAGTPWWLQAAGVATFAALTLGGLQALNLEGSHDARVQRELSLTPPHDPAASKKTSAASLVPVQAHTMRHAIPSEGPTADSQSSAVAGPAHRAQKIAELQRTSKWLQRAIKDRLLTPSPALVEAHAEFLAASPDHGIARVLGERGPIRGVSHALPIEGNGAYYSFATREHSYQASPDISFSQRSFSSGFNGGQDAGLLALGIVSLESVPVGADSPPPGFDQDERASWSTLWTDVTSMDAETRRAFDAELRREDRSLAPKRAGETYVVRMIDQREHDHIVAFQVLDLDTYGCTLLWRKLAEWPMPSSGSGYREPKSQVEPAPPEWLAAIQDLSVEDLLDQLKEAREELFPLLLEIPDELRSGYEKRSGAGADRFGVQGITRLLRRGSSAAILNVREGGAYFGFLGEERGYGSESDLQLNGQGRFLTGFAGGDSGWLLDLGVLDAPSLRAALADQNPFPEGKNQELWDFVRRAELELEGRRKQLTDEWKVRAEKLEISRRFSSSEGQAGHSYLLRTAFFDDRDVTVLFTVLDADSTSAVIAWRVLE